MKADNRSALHTLIRTLTDTELHDLLVMVQSAWAPGRAWGAGAPRHPACGARCADGTDPRLRGQPWIGVYGGSHCRLILPWQNGSQ